MELPPKVLAVAEAAFRAEYTRPYIRRHATSRRGAHRYVVAIYSPVEGLLPTPYFTYEVHRAGLAARPLSCDERQPHVIKNDK